MDLLIEPGRAGKNYWRDLRHYREWFCFLAWRDIMVCYQQTVIGIAWAAGLWVSGIWCFRKMERAFADVN